MIAGLKPYEFANKDRAIVGGRCWRLARREQPPSSTQSGAAKDASSSTGYGTRPIKRPIFASSTCKEKGLASLQGLDFISIFWLPDLGSNQGPTD